MFPPGSSDNGYEWFGIEQVIDWCGLPTVDQSEWDEICGQDPYLINRCRMKSKLFPILIESLGESYAATDKKMVGQVENTISTTWLTYHAIYLLRSLKCSCWSANLLATRCGLSTSGMSECYQLSRRISVVLLGNGLGRTGFQRMMGATHLHTAIWSNRELWVHILLCAVTSVDLHFPHAIRCSTTSFMAGRLPIPTRVSGRDQNICRIVGHNMSLTWPFWSLVPF